MSVKSEVHTDDECDSDCESCMGIAKDEPAGDEENEVIGKYITDHLKEILILNFVCIFRLIPSTKTSLKKRFA